MNWLIHLWRFFLTNSIDIQDDAFSTKLDRDIQRFIEFDRISNLSELKQLIRSLTDMIHGIILQIQAGSLSEKGARLKMIRCIELIQHCQLGHHPLIEQSMNRMIKIFEINYGTVFDFKLNLGQTNYLPNQKIKHNIELILDTQIDPIYSETTPIDHSQNTSTSPVNQPNVLEFYVHPLSKHTTVSNTITNISSTPYTVNFSSSFLSINPSDPPSNKRKRTVINLESNDENNSKRITISDYKITKKSDVTRINFDAIRHLQSNNSYVDTTR